jgi:hypothetical protein
VTDDWADAAADARAVIDPETPHAARIYAYYVVKFFHGLELIEPGVVPVEDWRPEIDPAPVLPPEGRTNPLWVGVGRKP